MANTQPYRIRSISQYHELMGLPRPQHPLISVVNMEAIQHPPGYGGTGLIFDYYSIAIKRNMNAKYRYGQQEYDFDEGVMFFIAPGQLFGFEKGRGEVLNKLSGWMLLIHPDFLLHTPLAKGIKKYEYFDYAVNEALYLSEKEEATINGIIKNIEQEYHSNIDRFSQDIIISQLEVLLNYSERFYQRQFITRKVTNHQILTRLETILHNYFSGEDLAKNGIPSVQYIAETLNVSPNYLSNLLKTLTGQSTQQHIQDKLIETAKQMLSAETLSVSEIAYQLGFEHPQSFSKLFKTKMKVTPLEYRQSFN